MLVVPHPVDGNAVTGDPRLGSGQKPLLAQHPVDEGRLASVGTPDNGNTQGTGGGASFRPLRLLILVFLGLDRDIHVRQRLLTRVCRFLGLLDDGKQRVIQIGEAFAMLGGHGNGIAKAETEGFVEPPLSRTAFGLVCDQDHGGVGAAQDVREMLVARRQSGARVDHEEHRIRIADGLVGLGAHAALERAGIRLLEPGRVENGEAQVAETRVSRTPVTGDTRAYHRQAQGACPRDG